MPKFDPRRIKPPGPIDQKFVTGDYVRDTTPMPNFMQISSQGASLQMGEI